MIKLLLDCLNEDKIFQILIKKYQALSLLLSFNPISNKYLFWR